MIKINKFYLNLYKNSQQGKKTIADFEKLLTEMSIENLVDYTVKYDIDYRYNADNDDIEDDFYRTIRLIDYCVAGKSIRCRHDAEDLIKRMIDECGSDKYVMSHIVPISIYLYQCNPEYFIPYFFLIRYRDLHNIISDYSIDVNEVNGKFSYKDRALYYLALCDALSEFRKANELSPAELCAFLYDMERQSYDSSLQENDTTYPRVWFLVGGKHGRETTAKTMFWEGNTEIRKGDICVFYETSKTGTKNKSSISGIWVAKSDGRIDPFFYYYASVLIGDEHKLSNPIPFTYLKENAYTSLIPHMGANLMGSPGCELTVEIYEKGILPLVRELNPDFDESTLPKIYHPVLPEDSISDRGDMKPEKWVEEHNIKPLLSEMGFVEGQDYLQQVFLQLGRDKEEGERVQAGRTDFSLFPFGNKRKGEPKCADVLIEVKAPGEMTNPKDIEKTFWQAESYASRQYAQLLIITDGVQFLLYPRTKDGVFRYSEPDSKIEQYTWTELKDSTSESFKKFRATLLANKKH